jgi:hypothetical protein
LFIECQVPCLLNDKYLVYRELSALFTCHSASPRPFNNALIYLLDSDSRALFVGARSGVQATCQHNPRHITKKRDAVGPHTRRRYVDINICVYTHMYIHIHVNTVYVCMCVYIYTHIYMNSCICMYVFLYHLFHAWKPMHVTNNHVLCTCS